MKSLSILENYNQSEYEEKVILTDYTTLSEAVPVVDESRFDIGNLHNLYLAV